MRRKRSRSKLGPRITEAREKAGMPQTALAKAIGCSHITVNRWERGWAHPGPEALAAICRALKVSADELLGLS